MVVAGRRLLSIPLLVGLPPMSRMLPEVVAGVSLAALAVPEVLGYARIAGMPVVTGVYTLLVPLVVLRCWPPPGTSW